MDNSQEAAGISPKRIMTPWQLFCFGVLTAPLAMGGLVLVIYIPTYYATEIGLGFAITGAVFAIGRIIDVFTDPLIGHMSDETRTRFGPRRPWIVFGVPGFCIAAWMLFSPPSEVGTLYLVVASTLYFLFYTIVDVPYSSIGLEISPHKHERSVLAGSKAAFQVIGAITAASLPFVLSLASKEALQVIIWLMAVLAAVGLALFLLYVPNLARAVTTPRLGIIRALKDVSAKRPYRRLVISFFIIQSANALTGGLTVLYVSHVVQAPQLVGLFLGLLFLSTALFLPVWIFLSIRFSKRTAWLISMLVCCLALAVTPFIGAGSTTAAAILCTLIGAVFGCDAIMPTSILADIIYKDELAGGSRLGGLALAVKNSVSKLTFIIPMGLAFPVLDLMQFDKAGANGEVQLMTLLFFFAGLPILLRLAAFMSYRTAPGSA